jgi:hypothetical protein
MADFLKDFTCISKFQGLKVVSSIRRLTDINPNEELRLFRSPLHGDFLSLSVRFAHLAEKTSLIDPQISRRTGIASLRPGEIFGNWKFIKARYIPGLHSSMSSMEKRALDTILFDFLWATMQGATVDLRVIYSESVTPNIFHTDIGGNKTILRTYTGEGTRFIPFRSATECDEPNRYCMIQEAGAFEFQSSPGDYTCHAAKSFTTRGTLHSAPNKDQGLEPRLIMVASI